jgi:vacuolar-type H+-ATPase subunit I/STV1
VDETKESKDKKNYVAPKKAVAVVEIKTKAEKVADDNKTNMEDRKYESEDKKDVNVEMNNEIRPGYVRTVLRIIRAMRDKREKKEENVDNQEGVESLAVMKNPEKDIMSHLND